MRKYTQKAIREYVTMGIATDITNYGFEETHNFIKTHDYEKIGYSSGMCGANGVLIQDRNTGEFYAITKRNSTLAMIF